MNDAFSVGRIERIGDGDRNIEQGFGIERPAGDDAVLKGLTVEKFHHDEGQAFILPDLVDSADVGVVKRRCGPRFAAETFQRLRIAGDILRQKLERDEAAELGVFGLVDHTHPAAAQLLGNAVMRDGLADHGEQCPKAPMRADVSWRCWTSQRGLCHRGTETQRFVFVLPARCLGVSVADFLRPSKVLFSITIGSLLNTNPACRGANWLHL